ncbi:MAG: DUF799 family lipoprotein [Nitrospinae bacterium]|nr:DUF799 family lipoprotein [Nitrospinota bacterium]
MKQIILIIIIFSINAIGCATLPPKDYTNFNAADIRSILVVPVVNNSVDVTAPDYFLSTVSIPVAELGYYVFPVNLVKRILEDDGLSDADLVHAASTTRLCELFGADAALYIIIERWDAKYMLLTTTVTVELTYILKSGVSGEVLWQDKQTRTYSPQSSSGGHPLVMLVSMLVNAAMAKAVPNYMPLAKLANSIAFSYPGPGFPYGPYIKSKENDSKIIDK